MGTTNHQFNDARIADLIWQDQANNSVGLTTAIDIDAPTEKGTQMASVTVTRTYMVTAETAKEWLKLAV